MVLLGKINGRLEPSALYPDRRTIRWPNINEPVVNYAEQAREKKASTIQTTLRNGFGVLMEANDPYTDMVEADRVAALHAADTDAATHQAQMGWYADASGAGDTSGAGGAAGLVAHPHLTQQGEASPPHPHPTQEGEASPPGTPPPPTGPSPPRTAADDASAARIDASAAIHAVDSLSSNHQPSDDDDDDNDDDARAAAPAVSVGAGACVGGVGKGPTAARRAAIARDYSALLGGDKATATTASLLGDGTNR